MSLYKRGNHWWIRFTSPTGKRIRQSAGTGDRRKAQEYHDRLKSRIWETTKLGVKPERSWQEATVRWLKETSYKADHEKDKVKLRWLDPHIGHLMLNEVTRDVVEGIAVLKEKEGCQPATVNRLLSLVRSILRAAWQDWEWIDKVPKVLMRKEPKQRIRFLTRNEAERLIEELPEHLAAMARFSLATGLRMRNVTGLEWMQVSLEHQLAWIHPDQAKAGNAIGVPLNSEALSVIVAQKGKHPDNVFTYCGKPVASCGTKAWYAAMKRAGIYGFRWHDLRHTWASWHAQSGTPLSVLQELGGWSSAEMVKRYAHLGAGHLAAYAERISFGTKLAHSEN